MANGNGTLASAWEGFDSETKLRLTVTELDRLHARLTELHRASSEEHSQIRVEFTNAIAAVKSDFATRIDSLRGEMREGFEKQEKRQSRSIGLLYTMIGGIVVGLVLLVIQLAPHS